MTDKAKVLQSDMEKEKMKIKKWAVIWKRDKDILALYRMKKTTLIWVEWQETTGDKEIFEGYAIFDRRGDAENYRQGNKDWEVVRVEITI